MQVTFKDKAHRYYRTDKKIDKGKSKMVPGVTGTSDNQFHLKGHLLNWAGKFDSRWLAEEIRNGKELTDDLIKEAATAHIKHRDKAAGIGSTVHELAEKWFTTGLKPQLPSTHLNEDRMLVAIPKETLILLDNALHNLGLIIENNTIEVLGLEEIYYYRPGKNDPTPEYAGTGDLRIIWNGVLSHGDWKTNNSDHYFNSKQMKKGKRVQEIQPTGLTPSVLYQLGGYDLACGQESGIFSKQHIGINLAKHRKYRTYKEYASNHIRIDTDVEANREAFRRLAIVRADSVRIKGITQEKIIDTKWY